MTPAKRLIMMGRKYKNGILNGNFVLDSNADGLADGFAVAEGSASVSGLSMTDGIQRFTPTVKYGGIRTNALPLVPNVYYASALVKSNKPISTHLNYGSGVPTNHEITPYTDIGNWQRISSLRGWSSVSGYIFSVIRSEQESDWDETQAKEWVVINLTTEFGAGNEPNLAWCNANIPQNIIW